MSKTNACRSGKVVKQGTVLRKARRPKNQVLEVKEVGAEYSDGSAWVISHYVTTGVMQFLVLDDLQDCCGVSRFFHTAVHTAIKYMSRKNMLSSAYFAPSRVSKKLARVRVGLNGPVSHKVSSNRPGMPVQTNKRGSKTLSLPLQQPNVNPLSGSALVNLPLVPGPKARPVAIKLNKLKQKRTIMGVSNLDKQVVKGGNKENTPCVPAVTKTSTVAIPSARVYCIQKPQKAPRPREKPSPPPGEGSQRTIQKHRVVARRKKNSLVQFSDMLEKEFLFKWRAFKQKREGGVKPKKSNKKALVTGLPFTSLIGSRTSSKYAPTTWY